MGGTAYFHGLILQSASIMLRNTTFKGGKLCCSSAEPLAGVQAG